MNILKSTIAGSWYPGTNDRLSAIIATYLDDIPEPLETKSPNILILPHAGYIYSGKTAAYGIKRIVGATFKRVILLAPGHRAYLKNQICAPEADAVSTPLGMIPIDKTILSQFSSDVLILSDQIHSQEHSTQIQYPFLQYVLNDFSVLPLIVGNLDEYGLEKLGELLASFMSPETLLLVSSDFTHYGEDFSYTPFRSDVRKNVEKLDMGAYEFIKDRNLPGYINYMERTHATICGRNPIALMLKMLSGDALFEMLHYETSADGDDDYSRFVCYMAVAGYAQWNEKKENKPGDEMLDFSDKKKLLEMARKCIANVFETGKALSPKSFGDEASPNMRRKMGAFVTLNTRDSGMLRGCIGEIEPMRPLYEAVVARAVDSAFRDPRFDPLSEREFENISIEVSALTPSRKVASWKDIVIGRHGMTVSKYGRSAVFLPQVAPEQGWTLEQTLTHLSMKAGLKPDDWKNGADFTVFEAIVFNENEFFE